MQLRLESAGFTGFARSESVNLIPKAAGVAAVAVNPQP